jgi:methyltransferase
VNVTAQLAVPLVALLAVVVMMFVELWLSTSNERVLRSHGAIEADDPVFALMRLAYPGVFIAMAVEGAIAGAEPGPMTFAGVSVMFAAKALKFWAIATLGTRWTYKVMVVPGLPPIATGPYRWLRHPNYAGVVGELIAMALMTRARITGPLGTVFFGWLLFRRIAAEERAMELYSRSGGPEGPPLRSRT